MKWSVIHQQNERIEKCIQLSLATTTHSKNDVVEKFPSFGNVCHHFGKNVELYFCW